jgi:hypothetical protein
LKYTFSFTEINFGSIEIESENEPSESEVTDAIANGGSFIKDTDYQDIELVGKELSKPKSEIRWER